MKDQNNTPTLKAGKLRSAIKVTTWSCSLVPLLLAAGVGLFTATACLGQDLPPEDAAAKKEEPAAKRERRAAHKEPKPVINEHVQHKVIVIKFQEGTHVRHRQGKLMAEAHKRSPQEKEKLQKARLGDSAISTQLDKFHQLLEKHPKHTVGKLFSRDEAELDNDKTEGEKNSDEELADLNLYFHIYLDEIQPEESAALINELNGLDVIEIAYAAPIGQDAVAADIWPTTPDFSASQSYLGPAPAGIDAYYAWNFSGGRGNGVRVIDIEANWNLAHEDLNSVFHASGVMWTPDSMHGTAVLGEIAAAENAYGMTGIAPQASIGVSAVYRNGPTFVVYDIADAINRAAGAMIAGDIILIEQHGPGPMSGLPCACNCAQFEYVPMEYWQAAYDAIRNATSRGLIVVEAAGNGSMNLDSPIYGGVFSRNVRDSGAVLVGAGTPSTHDPECWSNYGNRVDVQGWGDSVATLSYGDLAMVNGPDQREWYTAKFSGTSSAAPIVAGSVAAIQGVRKARGLYPLNSTQLRRLFSLTGTSQPYSTRTIGPLPNLRNAIDAHGATGYIWPNSSVNWAFGVVAPQGYRDFYFYSNGGAPMCSGCFGFAPSYQFSTCSYSDFDTVIEIYNPSGVLIGSNDDYCGWQSQVTVRAYTAGWYRVRMRGYASENGYFWMSYRTL